MQRLITALFILAAIVMIACTKNEEKKVENKPALAPTDTSTACPEKCADVDKALCADLVVAEKECSDSKEEKNCTKFVDTFQKAITIRVSCTSCDSKAYDYSMSDRCDTLETAYPKVTERSAYLISKLKFEKAKKVFASQEFYHILDGALAEDLMGEWQKAQK
jgi:hypothetical protein